MDNHHPIMGEEDSKFTLHTDVFSLNKARKLIKRLLNPTLTEEIKASGILWASSLRTGRPTIHEDNSASSGLFEVVLHEKHCSHMVDIQRTLNSTSNNKNAYHVVSIPAVLLVVGYVQICWYMNPHYMCKISAVQRKDSVRMLIM
ncbi:hypothetical protein J6590_002517 [Homalodisca vitripennis]|nr:hypothetical protein J6590_002517 [Homalodisca vitripennis]